MPNNIVNNLLFFVVFFFSVLCYSQHEKSNKNSSIILRDSTLVNSRKKMDSIAAFYHGKKIGLFLTFSRKSILLSRLLKDTSSFASTYKNMARSYSLNNELGLAVQHIDSSYKYYKAIKDTNNIISALTNKGAFYRNGGDLNESLKIYTEALEIVKDIDSTKINYDHYLLYNHLGVFYVETKKFDKAKFFYQKALSTCRLLKNMPSELSVKINLGAVASKEKKYNLALTYYYDVVKKADSINAQLVRAISRGNIAYVYYHQNRYQESIQYANEGFTLLNELNVNNGYRPIYRVNFLHTLGVANIEIGNYKLAEKHLIEGIKISDQYGLQSTLIMCNEGMYKLKLKEKNFKKALYYFQEHIKAKDSMFSVETLNEINKIESEKELSEKEKELTVLSIEKAESEQRIRGKYIQYIIFAIIVIVILIILILLYNQSNKAILAKNNQRILESELHALRSQMDPHFIFNTLNSVQNFILKSNKIEAYNYLIKFSDSIRLILENSKDSFIEIQKELDLINLYVDLQGLRFRNKIKYVQDIDPTVLYDTLKIPAMIIQPIIENAILHGLVNKKEGGVVALTLKHEGDCIQCVIEDNGIGRQEAMRRKRGTSKKHLSISTMNTAERIKILERNANKKVTYQIEDLFSKNGVSLGTRVSIILPILKPHDTET